MKEEIWKDIEGYEGYYQVSDLGRVKRLPRGRQWPYRQTHNNIRKQHVKNGYLQVNLSKDNKVKWVGVHRLVAMAFIPNPNNYPQVNHIDECKTNNVVTNLEWCTQSQNQMHGTARQRQNETRHKNDPDKAEWKAAALKHAKRVAVCDKKTDAVLETFVSMADAATATGASICTISNQCKGKRKSRRNYYWRYENEVQ
jgi:hypothetical protein